MPIAVRYYKLQVIRDLQQYLRITKMVLSLDLLATQEETNISPKQNYFEFKNQEFTLKFSAERSQNTSVNMKDTIITTVYKKPEARHDWPKQIDKVSLGHVAHGVPIRSASSQ